MANHSPRSVDPSQHNAEQQQPPLTGVDAWNARREEWTCSRSNPPNQAAQSNDSMKQAFDSMSKRDLLGVFKALVVERRNLSRPIPLEIAIKVLVQGWKQDGTWPADPSQD